MKYATAILNIKPAEFWELTLAEFNVAMESYEWTAYQERKINAAHALWTITQHAKADEMPPIEDLVGPAPGEEKEEKEKEVTTQDDLEDMMKRMGKRSEEHTSELQSRFDLVCRLLLEKKKYKVTKEQIHLL